MEVIISRRHTSPLPKLQTYVQEKLDRLTQQFDHLHGATVILEDDAGHHCVEMAVSADGGPRFVAKASSDDWKEAVNHSLSKLETQLRRFFDRRRQRKRA